MNLDSLSFALSQINYLILNLNKKNFKPTQTEINSLIEINGFEAERHFYRSLLSSIDFNTETKLTSKDYHQTQLLKECLISSLGKPHLSTLLCYAIENPLQSQESQEFPNNLVSQITKLLKLTQIQEFCLAVVFQETTKEEIKKSSQELVNQKVKEFLEPSFDITKKLGNLNENSVQLIHQFLSEIQKVSSITNSQSAYNTFISKLLKDNSTSNLIQALLKPNKTLDHKESELEQEKEKLVINLKMEYSIVESIQELGYNFTANQEECKSTLKSLTSSMKDALNSTNIARILGMMARTHNTLQIDQQSTNENWLENKELIPIANTWNVDVFVLAISEIVPNISWKEVVKEFDHPEFFIRDKLALKIIVQALKIFLKDSFPIENFYRVWKNPEGQLSWIIQSLKHPDIFCIADYPCRRTATECLKAQPEDDNRLTVSWRSLNLLEVLLNLSETGIYSNCIEIFKFPITHCPDLLLLGLLQLNTVWNKLKQELISALIPIFLGNHPNSAVILQHAWNQHYNTQIIRTLIMNSMADWYMKAQDTEQSIRLARILDVSQDLKALSTLLNGQPLIFNVDLACLAARRGYLKLDKWMSDRIRDHGELFISTVVAFLRKKCPQLSSSSNLSNKDDQMSNRPMQIQMPLQLETIQTILKCIGASTNSVNSELSQEIVQMNVQARLLLDKPNLLIQPQSQQIKLPLQNSIVNNPGTIDMLSMMSNLNINPVNFPQNNNLNSNNFPSSNVSNPNMILSNNNVDASKMNVLINLLNNHQPRTFNYSTNTTIRNLNSPQINSNNPGIDTVENKDVSVFSREIEEEVEKCIQRLFKINNTSPVLSVDDFVDILGKFKDSQDKKEKEFYSCALKYIIDANSCLHGLDEMQFHTMALIWGTLIDRGIFSNPILSIFLKILLQMLIKPTNSRYYLFGIKVLEKCKTRLKDYSQICMYLLQSNNFQEFPRSLKEFVEYGSRGILPPSNFFTSQMPSLTPPINLASQHHAQQIIAGSVNSIISNKFGNNPNQSSNLGSQIPNSASLMNSVSASGRNINTKPSIANTTNIDTLLANENDTNSKPVAPSENIQDKIGFIFNNLSLSNMQSKGDELKDTLKEEFWDWIAHYLVVKRVSIEPNFHMLYSQFVDSFKKESLNDCILAETYRNIKVLLRSDKNDQKFCDRALLKNLGSWLGLITLAKNRPILHRDIDLKSLIVEAFQKGQAELLFVVPFVAKVLEPANKSKIFQPPNPWLLSMLSVLVELHNEPDLKLNHKFEIEVLCKNLNLNINEIQVKGILRNYEISDEQLTKHKDQALVSNSASSANMSQFQANEIHEKSNLPSIINQNLNQPISISQHQPVHQHQAEMAMPDINTNQNIQVQNNPAIVVQAPKFRISDIKLHSLQSNSNLIYISPDVPLLNAQPALKNFIIPALDKAVNEMMPLLLEKTVKVSVSTAEPIIKKDFALDPEESHIRIAARNMVANMSSGMMLITGKEPLSSHLFNALRIQLTQPLDSALANAFKDMIIHACNVIVQDNIELCMCFLQKMAIQRSIMELERKLQIELDSRMRAKSEGRAHYDPNVLNYHNEKMPDTIRLRVGSLSSQQLSVYEEFGKNLPGFKINVEERSNFSQAVDEMNIHYDNAISMLTNEAGAIMPMGHFLSSNLQSLARFIHDFKVTQQPQSAINLIKKLVYNLLDTMMPTDVHISSSDLILAKYREFNINVLKVILSDQRFCAGNWIVKEVQKIWLECTQDFKYCVEGIALLFKYKLLSVSTVDSHLSQLVDSGNTKAILIAIQLLKFFYIENANTYPDVQFNNLMESVNRISSVSRYAQQNTELKDIIEVIRMNYESDELGSTNRISATALSMMYSGVQQAREFDDPPGLKEKSDQLLHDWIQSHSVLPQKENTKAFQQFVVQMNTQGLFKTDDMITRFFRICTENCVETCYMYLGKGQRQSCYQRLDAFVKLIILLVKHSGDQTNHLNKINLFNKVLGLIAGCLLYDHENKSTQFEPMPFHRLFFMLMFEATLPENNLEPIIFNILQAFVNVYHIVRPTKAPGFAYSWLELVAHRIFISRMLQVSQPAPDQNCKTWTMFATLITQLIKFLAPFLRNIELTQSIMLLYKGTLRLFLVLLHDFPEFLCNCHYQFCDFIPPNCIQLRNLVLSAFPRSMKLPDPLTPNLKVDMIGDIDSTTPKISYPYIYNIPQKLKNDLDSYIKTRSPVTFLSDLRSYLQSSPDTGSHYNIQLMNALVIYVGTYGIQAIRSKGLIPSLTTLTHSAHSAYSDIFQSLVVDLDSEGRYLFINAVANQLRYPNSHTHYFGCALLNLFSEANTEAIQEQITRVLLERLIVNRPHPWGLLVTFIELIKNTQFKFWNHQFVHCAPEIEKMFQSLGRNCVKT